MGFPLSCTSVHKVPGMIGFPSYPPIFAQVLIHPVSLSRDDVAILCAGVHAANNRRPQKARIRARDLFHRR